MPDTHRQPGTAADRARFRDAVTDTHQRGADNTDEFREQREHYVREADSLATERRILREDFAHWDTW